MPAQQGQLRLLVNRAFHGKEPYHVVRTVVLAFLTFRFLRKLRFVMGREGVKAYLVNALVPYIKKLPQVRQKLDKEVAGTLDDLRTKFSKELTQPRATLPTEGFSEAAILNLMAERKELDTKHWKSGKITGAVYHGDDKHYDFIGQVFSKWGFANPLHPGIHPALRQMDSEVVQMIINMYGGNPGCCGAFTTGGTESILMAMKTYRDCALAEKGIQYPNIVICSTAHAAFDKAGKYFNIFVKHAQTNDDMEIDLRHMESLIDGNTVAIVGSACQYAHGTIDPIEQMAAIARRKNIGLHVDCCLGGFLVPFMEKAGFPIQPVDFRVDGVTSISCDPHKYGFAPKGSSVVMFSSKHLRSYMYCYVTKWSGGIYATPTMSGSRAGGPVAATWAAMCKFGESGYIETTRTIVGACRRIGKGIQSIPELRLVGRPEVCVVAFAGAKDSGVNCYSVADCMNKTFGWEIASCQNPPSVHLALTLPSSRNAELFLENLKEAVDMVKASPADYASSAGLYGMAASLPASFLDDAAGAYLDAMSEAFPPVPAVAGGA